MDDYVAHHHCRPPTKTGNICSDEGIKLFKHECMDCLYSVTAEVMSIAPPDTKAKVYLVAEAMSHAKTRLILCAYFFNQKMCCDKVDKELNALWDRCFMSYLYACDLVTKYIDDCKAQSKDSGIWSKPVKTSAEWKELIPVFEESRFKKLIEKKEAEKDYQLDVRAREALSDVANEVDPAGFWNVQRHRDTLQVLGQLSR
ncbi:hypothetical protein KEM56_002313 [Ascosphaera pollenicola]|nr:hypothetical protein KEM56_002313 [Ascosphaera pollenicola]